MDSKPRKVDANSAQILSNIAELTVRELEKKWAMELERACLDHVLRSLDCYDQGFLFVEASKVDWQIIHVSPAAAQETGARPGTFFVTNFLVLLRHLQSIHKSSQPFVIEHHALPSVCIHKQLRASVQGCRRERMTTWPSGTNLHSTMAWRCAGQPPLSQTYRH